MYKELYSTYSEPLKALDLSEKEIQTYLSLMANGAQTADQISKTTSLNRSTVYVQIDVLNDKGLVSDIKEGKKTFFIAESPEHLKELVRAREERAKKQATGLNELLPDLLRTFSNSSAMPSIRNYSGKQGLITMRNEMVAHTDKTMKIITDHDAVTSLFAKSELVDFTERRRKKKIFTKIIYTLKEGDDFVPFVDQELRRVDYKKHDFGTEMYISEHAIAVASVKDNLFGTLIVDNNISKTINTLFEALWMQHD